MSVPDEKFPKGVATFYLFDKDGKYLSERSIYIKEDKVIVKTTSDKAVYSKRERVVLNISVTDRNNRPVPSLLTLSVTDTAFISPGAEILPTTLSGLATSDNPIMDYNQNMTDANVDLLMLVSNQTYVSRTSTIAKLAIDRNDSLLFIKGTALDKKDKPAADKVLTLFTNNGSASFVTDTTDNTGIFRLPVYNYPDSTEFAIDARNLNNNIADIKIIREPLAFPRFNTPASLKLYFPHEPVFTNRYKSNYFDTVLAGRDGLEEVTVTGKKKKDVTYNEALRVSPTSTIIAADKLDERRTTGDIVLTVGGMHVIEGVLIVNGLTSMGKPTLASEPLLLIDGVQAPVMGVGGESAVLATLNSINPKEIDFIEILKGPEGSNYGLRGGNGVILVNMAHESRKNFSTGTGNLQTFYAKGISKLYPFPSVNYDNKEIKSSTHFDNRSTLYWNANILTGATDSMTISFFTSDVATTYRVSVKGVTVNGEIIEKTLFFRSK